MKTKSLFIIIICLVFFGAFLRAQWVSQSTGVDGGLSEICFTDSLNGWVCGSNYYNSFILHSVDGGDQWEIQYDEQVPWFKSICFVDDSNGWVVGSMHPTISYIILHTNDGGITWEEQFKEGTSLLNSVYFTSCDNGWTSGGASFYHTIDGGQNWQLLNPGPGGTPSYDIFFFDEDNGWIVGESGSLHHTSDGGETWEEQTSTPYDLLDVFFVSDSIGWAVGCGYWIIHTIDAGDSWITQHNAPYNEGHFYSVCFADKDKGWVVGSHGRIMYTEDGGLNWEDQASGTVASLNSVCFTDLNNGWICSSSGNVLHTDNGGITCIESPILQNFDLVHSVFPNPFSNSTTINYTLDKPATISLRIFNSRGQLIKEIQQNQPNGEQQVQWNPEGLPAGMYYFRIQAGDKVGGGKMVLMR